MIKFVSPLLLALSILASADCSARPRYSEPIPSPQEIPALESKVIELVNLERAKFALKPLKHWKVISDIARKHSKNMAAGRVPFGHEGFHDRSHEIMNSARRIRATAENVAYNYGKKDRLKAAVVSWMNSPGHRKNILGDYNETGVGIAFDSKGKCYLNQMFARRSSR